MKVKIWVAGLVLGMIIAGLVVCAQSLEDINERNVSGANCIIPKSYSVSGHITTNTWWNFTDSPIYIEGDVTINANVTLTIESGVEVKFNGSFYLWVEGNLSAIGKPDNRIIFTSNKSSPAKQDWDGIQVNSTGCIKMEYCDITYTDTGILTGTSSNNRISNCNISNSYSDGIYIGSWLGPSLNNEIVNCTIYNSTGTGIIIDKSSNNKIFNCNISYNDDGIYSTSGASNNTIINCIVYNNTHNGILLTQSSSTRLINCTIHNSGYGIELNEALNNEITNCALYNDSKAIYFCRSSNNSITECDIYNSSRSIWLYDSSYNTIINTTIFASTQYDVYLTGNSYLLALNTTFNETKVNVTDSAIFDVCWYLDVKVIDINAKPIHYANVNVKDNRTKLVGNFATDREGWAKNIACLGYTQNITSKNYSMNDYNVTVGNCIKSLNISKTGNTNITLLVSYFSIASPITTTVSYENYLVVQENNLTVAEKGNLILSNVTLKMNCSYNGSLAIEVLSGGEMHILNNSKITSTNPDYHYLFWVRNGSKFEMRDSELSECGWDWENKGFVIETNNVSIESSIISDNYVSVAFQNSSNNTITNSTIYNNYRGIYLNYSSNNILSGNRIYNNSDNGVLLDSYSNNNLIMANRIYNNSVGVWIGTSSNNTLAINYVYNNSCGVWLEYFSHNNLVVANHVYDNSVGTLLYKSSDNTIAYSLFYNNGYGINISSAENTRIESCVILNSTHVGINIFYLTTYIINSSIAGSGLNDTFLHKSTIAECINTTFETVFVDANSTLNVSWYLHINVLWNNSVPAEEANVSVQDFNCTFDLITRTTDEFGWVRNIVVQEYTQNQTNTTYFTPYYVNASQAAFWKLTYIPITNTTKLILYLDRPFLHNAPEIIDTTISPQLSWTITENETVEFKLNVSHPDNFTLTYFWYLNDTEVKNGTLENTNIAQELNWSKYFDYLSGTDEGKVYKIKIKISDGNATVSRTWTLMVINLNAPPMIVDYSPSWYTMSITEDQNITFSVTAIDVDVYPEFKYNPAIDYNLSYWWYIYYEQAEIWNWSGSYGGVTAGCMIIFGPRNISGNYTVKVRVYETQNESSRTEHNWIVRVWNVTELNQQIASLQQEVNATNNVIANLTSEIAGLKDNISSLQDQLNALNDSVTTLLSQISNLTSQLSDALNKSNESKAAEEKAIREREEALKVMHEANYRLATAAIGSVVGGIFAGAFIFSLLMRRKRK